MFGNFVVIVLIFLALRSVQRSQAAKKHIENFDDDQRERRHNQLLVQLTRKCVLNQQQPMTMGEGLNDEFVRYLHRSHATSITSIASSKLSVDDSYSLALDNMKMYVAQRYFRFQWKSGGFLMFASSPGNLKEQIQKLKISRWWNSAGRFVFIEDLTTAERCSNAYDFLSLAWTFELLSSVFLCQELDGNFTMYSYDPFRSSAPQPWSKVREVKGRQGHPWSLFKWEKYDGRGYGCEIIFFDKTKTLDGYPILMNAVPLYPFLFPENNSAEVNGTYRGEDWLIMKNLWRFLNASIVDVSDPMNDNEIGWVDDTGTIHGHFIAIAVGKTDIGYNSMSGAPTWKVLMAYPHTTVNICVMSKHRGTIPWLIGLTMIFDIWTSICALVTFFLIMIIFGYVDKARYFASFLNALRVFVSASFLRPPSSTSLRMMLCFVLLQSMIYTSVIQGNILSLIRNPRPYANIDTKADFVNSGYALEGSQRMQIYIGQAPFAHLFVVNELDDCLKKLYKNEPVMCLNYCYTLFLKASRDERLHVANFQSAQYPNRFIGKTDWALMDRFNVILRRIVEAGLTVFYRSINLSRELRRSTTYRGDPTSDGAAVTINLYDFRFIFWGLGIGWVCGVLAFIGELLVASSKKTRISEGRRKSTTLRAFGTNSRPPTNGVAEIDLNLLKHPFIDNLVNS